MTKSESTYRFGSAAIFSLCNQALCSTLTNWHHGLVKRRSVFPHPREYWTLLVINYYGKYKKVAGFLKYARAYMRKGSYATVVYVTVSWMSNERYPNIASFAMSRVTFYPYSKCKITHFHLEREEIRNEFRQRTVHKMNIDLTYKWSQQLFPSPRYMLSSKVRTKCPIMRILRLL